MDRRTSRHVSGTSNQSRNYHSRLSCSSCKQTNYIQLSLRKLTIQCIPFCSAAIISQLCAACQRPINIDMKVARSESTLTILLSLYAALDCCHKHGRTMYISTYKLSQATTPSASDTDQLYFRKTMQVNGNLPSGWCCHRERNVSSANGWIRATHLSPCRCHVTFRPGVGQAGERSGALVRQKVCAWACGDSIWSDLTAVTIKKLQNTKLLFSSEKYDYVA